MTPARRAPSSKKWRLIFLGVTVAVGAAMGPGLFELAKNLRPLHRPVGPPPADIGGETLRFVSGDGVVISGWFVPPKNGATIIVIHGMGADRSSMAGQVRFLATAGYGVLAYDQRGHGESGGNFRTYGRRGLRDVQAAISFLHQRQGVDATNVGILGFSVGGQLAIRAGAYIPEIRAVVADAPAASVATDASPGALGPYAYLQARIFDWGLSVISQSKIPPGLVEEIAKVAPKPLLYVWTGRADVEGREAQHRYSFAHEPKKLLGYPCDGHLAGLDASPEAYRREVLDFFSQALLDHGSMNAASP